MPYVGVQIHIERGDPREIPEPLLTQVPPSSIDLLMLYQPLRQHSPGRHCTGYLPRDRDLPCPLNKTVAVHSSAVF